MSELLLQLVKAIVAALVEVLTPEKVKQILDKAFDKIEDMVADTSTHFDNVVFLPLIKALRKALDVPDNDDTATDPAD